jgi:hypothetical protein
LDVAAARSSVRREFSEIFIYQRTVKAAG